jgi:hypothetical protein
MTRDNWIFVGVAAYFLIFVVGVGSIFLWKVKRRGGRAPVAFKLLRGPGETLRRRIAKFDEDALTRIGGAAFIPALAILPVLCLTVMLRPQTWTGLWIGLGISAVVFVGTLIPAGKWALKDLKRYRDDSLGYLGEPEVAEHLEPLLARGYRVFHDVPAKGAKTDFNLDHVAVGPSGVALVETKTLRKGKTLPGRKDYVVFYDGNKLAWPWRSENRYGLDQAINEADWLKKFIHQRTGIDTEVKPILALPGWWVEPPGQRAAAVAVTNSKNIANEIMGFEQRVLSDDEIDLIARQLDVLCRDVVG